MYKKNNPAKILLTNNTAYLAGVIIGDGHIDGFNKSKFSKFKNYRIRIDLSDMGYLKKLFEIVKSLVLTNSKPYYSKVRSNRLKRMYFQITNKELFLFFNDYLKIPSGKKSNIISVPRKIFNSSISVKKHFLAGYFDTDGGFRGKTLGFTTASVQMQQDVSMLLSELKICHSIEKWFNNKYHRYYYGIRIKRKEIDTFLNILPLRNKEKLAKINARFRCGDTKVAKWGSSGD